MIDYLAKQIIYLDLVQYFLAPAEYIKFAMKLPDYYSHSLFLPWLNNEV